MQKNYQSYKKSSKKPQPFVEIMEPGKKIPVVEDFDVVVIGGGPGGIPAAVAAARQGAKTLLIERYGVLGGLATTCLMGPLFGYAPFGGNYDSWVARQKGIPSLLGGIPLELVRRLQKIDGAPNDKKIIWQSINFDPELFKFVCDDIVVESKVNLLLHSWAVSTIVEDRKIKAIIVENKSGRQAITGKMFIDATGDGDIAFFSGCSYSKGRPADKALLAFGSRFRIGGLRSRQVGDYKKCVELTTEAIVKKKLHMLSAWTFDSAGSSVRYNECTPDITRRKGDGTNVKDLTRGEIQIRKDTYEIFKFLKEKVPGFENSYILDTPFTVGVRETRQINGLYKLTTEDVVKVKKFPETTIARGCWFFDLHCPLARCYPGINFTAAVCSKKCEIDPPCIMHTKFPDQLLDTPYLPEGEYYDIPYGTIVAKDIDNLLISGRAISASHEAMSSARVIGTCFAIGEAAGIAASLSIEGKVIPKNLSVKKLQEKLMKKGVLL